MERVARYLAVATVATTSASGSMLAAAPTTHPAQLPQRPVFTASVEQVRLSVAVFDADDVPVPGLGIQDFFLSEDGYPQRIDLLLTPNDTPLDVALVLDFSSSIDDFATTLKEDAQAFLDALSPRDCVYLLPFRTRVGPGIWGSGGDQRLHEFIDRAEMEGSTAFYDALLIGLHALETAREQRSRSGSELACRTFDEDQTPETEQRPPGTSTASASFDRRQALVVLTDGDDEASATGYGNALRRAWESKIPVFPVAVGIATRQLDLIRLEISGIGRMILRGRQLADQLRELARATGGTFTRGQGNLRDAYNEVLNTLRASYVVIYSPTSSNLQVDQENLTWHEVEVKTGRQDLRVATQDGYYRTAINRVSAQEKLEEGQLLLQAQQADSALTLFTAAIGDDPGFTDAYIHQAIALGMLERFDDAHQAALRALDLDAGRAKVHDLVSTTSMYIGDYEAAWTHAIRSQQASGDDASARFALLQQYAAPPPDLAERLAAPRIVVQVKPVASLVAQEVSTSIARTLRRSLVQFPTIAVVTNERLSDYLLFVQTEELSEQSSGGAEVTIELGTPSDGRIFRRRMTLSDVGREEARRSDLAPHIQDLVEQLSERH